MDVLIFERIGSVWSVAASFTGDCNFANAVAVDGNTVVATGGADFATTRFYSRTSDGWVEDAALDTELLNSNDMAPRLAFDGDVAVVGTPSHGRAVDGGLVGSHEGAAFVFVRQGGVWGLDAKLTAPDAIDFDYFGWSVAVSSCVIAIGSPSSTHSSQYHPGHVYLFRRVDGEWRNVAKLGREVHDDQFGFTIAARRPWLAVSQPGPNGSAGATWLYRSP